MDKEQKGRLTIVLGHDQREAQAIVKIRPKLLIEVDGVRVYSLLEVVIRVKNIHVKTGESKAAGNIPGQVVN